MTKILIIERNRVLQRLLELQLAQLGYDPIPCVDPEHEPAGRAFDVAVVEPLTPGATSFARRLRAERPDVPLVFVSVRHPSRETVAVGPDAHLVKPFKLERLEAAITAAAARYGCLR